MVVAPGFIDMLGQSEISILVEPRLPSKIYQGITTEITGEGYSAAPQTAAIIGVGQDYVEYMHAAPEWRTFHDYFARLEKQGMGVNLGSYVGATQVRQLVVGEVDRRATTEELTRMKGLVRDAMKEGAMGLSSSLQYAPAPYASTDELIALASEAAAMGGIYATHMRDESDAIGKGLDEAFQIGREARIPVEIFHLKVAGKNNWGRMPEVVARIEEARRAGVDVSADTYAYTAWANAMSAFVPPWAHDGGDDKMIERLKEPATRARIRHDLMTPATTWDNEWLRITGPEAVIISVVRSPQLLPLQGKTLARIADEQHQDAMDVLFDLLIADHASTTVAVFGMSEPDVALALAQPWVSVGCDSPGTSPDGILGREHPHPRAYGTFPRILRRYVREEKRLTLEEAVRKFTSLPASRVHLADRGVLAVGAWADVVVFDPGAITDVATFDDPNRLSVGMSHVLVNGVSVIADGKMTGALPGKVLRGAGALR